MKNPSGEAQPFRLDQIVVVGRYVEGRLDFRAPQPPPPECTFEALYRAFWQENPEGGTPVPSAQGWISPGDRSASWGDLRAWLESKSWVVRAKTW